MSRECGRLFLGHLISGHFFRPGRVCRAFVEPNRSTIRRFIESTLGLDDPTKALEALREQGFIARWLPELQQTVELTQEAGRRHKDVWKHTLQVVTQAENRLVVRWAALLHDIGKPKTRSFENGTVSFHGHEEVGARLFAKISRRLAFPASLFDSVHKLIAFHLRPAQYQASWTDAAVRRLARDLGDDLEDLLALSRADVTSGNERKRARAQRRIQALSQRIDALVAEQQARIHLPTGLGSAIMRRFSLEAGPLIGRLHDRLKQAIAAGDLEANQPIDYYLSYLKSQQSSLRDCSALETTDRND
jgi:poly(A) polymerase